MPASTGFPLRNDSAVFIDKVVSAKREPILYNISAAQMALKSSTGPYGDLRQMRTPITVESRRDIIAQDVLQMMNVARVDIDKNFSLLEAQSNEDAIDNPSIMDRTEYKNTINEIISAVDKFVNVDDPFWQLDDAINSGESYREIKSIKTKQVMTPVDLSLIAATMNIVNQSSTYFGKNKYF